MIHSLKKWLMAGAVFVNATTVAVAKETSPVPEAAQKGDRVLVVVTNHAKYPSRDDATGVWLTELTHFVDVFRTAGIEMDFVSPEGGAVPVDERSQGWLYSDAKSRAMLKNPVFVERLRSTLSPNQVHPLNYAAVFYTGGHGTMWDFRGNAGLKRVSEQIYRQGGVVASVCHGAAGLLDLKAEDGNPLIKGRKITGFSNFEEVLSGMKDQVPYLLEDELVMQGAAYEKSLVPFSSYVVTDGRIVTGQNPGSSAEIAQTVLRVLRFVK